MAVSASVGTPASCTSLTVSALSFGTIASAGTAAATSTVTVNCTTNVTFGLTAQGGQASNCVAGTEYFYMGATAGAFPAYTLYKDTAHSLPLQATNTVCGNATPITGPGTGGPLNITLYGQVLGQVASGPIAPTGSYTDTAVIQVTF